MNPITSNKPSINPFILYAVAFAAPPIISIAYKIIPNLVSYLRNSAMVPAEKKLSNSVSIIEINPIGQSNQADLPMNQNVKPSAGIDEKLIESIEGEYNIANSKIVFLSDIHSDEKQNIGRQQFLNRFMKDGDILLLEGIPFSEEKLDEKYWTNTNLITSNVKLHGWESKKLYEIAVKNFLKINEIYEKIKIETDPKILASLDQEFWDLHNTRNIWAIGNRNEFMAEKISLLLPSLSENQQIFVIAGKDHLDHELLSRFEGKYSAIFFKENPDLDLHSQFPSQDNNLPNHINSITVTSSLRILTIQLPDGTTDSFGSGWFEEQAFAAGSMVKFKKDVFESQALWGTIVKTLNKEMKESFLNNPDQSYLVIRSTV